MVIGENRLNQSQDASSLQVLALFDLLKRLCSSESLEFALSDPLSQGSSEAEPYLFERRS